MSQKIIFSFLGTGNYKEAPYTLDQQAVSTPYTAHALAQMFPSYSVKVLLTPEAKAKHGQILASVLDYIEVSIPSGKTQGEIWEMFLAIEAATPPEAAVVFDITHGFRSQPVLALAAMIYLRTTKNVTIERIVYGAYDEATNAAPFFDLLPFLQLINWSFAAQDLLQWGEAGPMRQLLSQLQNQSHKQEGPKALNLKPVGQSLEKLGDALGLNRLQELHQIVEKLDEHLLQVETDLEEVLQSRPLALLLEMLRTRYKPLAQVGHKDAQGLKAQAHLLRVLLDTKRYAQAITVAREALVTWVCLAKDHDPIYERFVAESRLSTWDKNLQSKKLGLPPIEEELAALWHDVSEFRNDVNHAGMRDPYSRTERLADNLKKFGEKVATFLLEHPPQ